VAVLAGMDKWKFFVRHGSDGGTKRKVEQK
jgi:hypothetical protein